MVKKALLSLAGLLVLLAVVLLWRADHMPSRQVATEPAPDIAVDGDAAARRFAGAIRFPTISHERVEDTDTAAFLALHDYFATTYPRVHANLTRETVADLSLLYSWEGTDPALPPAVLMGHMDVVPVVPGTEAEWLHDPYGGDIVNGEVWGRGSMDDKVSVVSILEAVEALLAEGYRPRRTFYLAFGHDEEVGGVRGAAAMARLLGDRGAGPYAFVLDEGGAVVRDMIPGIDKPVAIVGIAEKGYVNLELRVEGPGGHSSTPPGHTNIGILAQAIHRLEENPFPARFAGVAQTMFDYLAPEMSLGPRLAFANLWLARTPVTHMLMRTPQTAAMVRTTTAVTIIEGGVKANVLPITAQAVVNHRILPGETVQSVAERVRLVIDDDRVTVTVQEDEAFDPSPVSDPDGPAFHMLARTIRQTMAPEEVLVTPYLVMGGTDAKHYSGASNAVFRFIPAPLGAEAMELAHGTNERMGVEGLVASIRFFQQLIRNSDGM